MPGFIPMLKRPNTDIFININYFYECLALCRGWRILVSNATLLIKIRFCFLILNILFSCPFYPLVTALCGFGAARLSLWKKLHSLIFGVTWFSIFGAHNLLSTNCSNTSFGVHISNTFLGLSLS